LPPFVAPARPKLLYFEPAISDNQGLYLAVSDLTVVQAIAHVAFLFGCQVIGPPPVLRAG
jgi:hypothetical protein